MNVIAETSAVSNLKFKNAIQPEVWNFRSVHSLRPHARFFSADFEKIKTSLTCTVNSFVPTVCCLDPKLVLKVICISGHGSDRLVWAEVTPGFNVRKMRRLYSGLCVGSDA